jgi:putative transposase
VIEFRFKAPEMKQVRTEVRAMTMTRPPFIPFDERRAVRIYQRSLPHWRQDGATYFVTFRLGDSIPAHVTREWDDERRRWITARLSNFNPAVDTVDAAVSRLSAADQFQYHKHFNQKMQDYLDRGFGECHLQKQGCMSIVRNEILSNDGASYHVGDFGIMPNHVHLLLLAADDQGLEGVLRRIKGASSRSCNLSLQRRGRFWQPESYDHIVRSLDQLLAYRDYIGSNPKRAGITIHRDALYQANWMDEWFKTQPWM